MPGRSARDLPPFPYNKLKPLPLAALLFLPACLAFFIPGSDTPAAAKLAFLPFLAQIAGLGSGLFLYWLLRSGLGQLPLRQSRLLAILFGINGFSQFVLLAAAYFPTAAIPIVERAWSVSSLSTAGGFLLLCLRARHPRLINLPQNIFGVMAILICLFIAFPVSPAPWGGETALLLKLSLLLTVTAIYLSFRGSSYPQWLLPLRLTMISLAVADALFFWALHQGQQPSPLAFIYKSSAAGWLFLPHSWQQKISRVRGIAYSAIQRARTANQLLRTGLHCSAQQERLQWDLFQSLGTITSTQSSLTDILNALVNQAAKTFRAQYIFLYLLEGKQPLLWVIASSGNIQLPPISLEQKFMANRYLDGKTSLVTNLANHYHRLPPELVQSGALSFVGSPIQCGSELAGVIELYADQAAAFGEKEANLLSLFAHQAGTAILGARKLDACMSTTHELDLLNQIFEIMSEQTSASLLLAKVSTRLGEFLHADAIAAFILQRHGDTFVLKDALAQNFSSDEIKRLKDLFAKGQSKWLSETTYQQSGGRSLIRLSLTNQKSIEILPLFSRSIPQGMIIFLWDYNRKLETDARTDATLRSIANQTAVNLERHYLLDNMQKIGLTDALTELSNRRFFDYVLKREVTRALRYGHPLTLLMFDIDHFKKVNDTWGHTTGDTVLKELGHLTKQGFRRSDIPCRYGGEEFAVILPETSPQDAFILAERFRLQVMNTVLAAETLRISLTISTGLAAIEPGKPGSIARAADLVLAADRSLYQAKQNGRNQTHTWRKL